jgi:hypothetical protein
MSSKKLGPVCRRLEERSRVLMVDEDLHPANEAQGHEALGLHLNWNIKVLNDGVHSKWYAAWVCSLC